GQTCSRHRSSFNPLQSGQAQPANGGKAAFFGRCPPFPHNPKLRLLRFINSAAGADRPDRLSQLSKLRHTMCVKPAPPEWWSTSGAGEGVAAFLGDIGFRAPPAVARAWL